MSQLVRDLAERVRLLEQDLLDRPRIVDEVDMERQPRPDQPIFLTIKSDLTLWLGDAPVSSTSLQAALDGISKGDRNQRVFLRADRSVPYGSLMEKMNALRTAGYLKVALVGLETESSR